MICRKIPGAMDGIHAEEGETPRTLYDVLEDGGGIRSFRTGGKEKSTMMRHEELEELLHAGAAEKSRASLDNIVRALTREASEEAVYLVPVFPREEAGAGDSFSLCLLKGSEDDSLYLPIYTSEEAFARSGEKDSRGMPLDFLIRHVAESEELSGIVINRYGTGCCLDRIALWTMIENMDRTLGDSLFSGRMIGKAIRFALRFHGDQQRKGTKEPFLTHPLEVLSILNSMGLVESDPRLAIAGILHDTVEDTPATLDGIRWHFGPDVASLVGAHTEDKALDWDTRKQQLIDSLKEAGLRVRILVLADVLANLRSLCRDDRLQGDTVWDRFHAPREKQAWYYSRVQDALADLQEYPETAPAYWEMVGRFKDLFVTFAYDEPQGLLLQRAADGECFAFFRAVSEWLPWTRPLPSSARTVRRQDAERIEDNWREAASRTCGDEQD